MRKLITAASLVAAATARYNRPGFVDINAGADPNFGGEEVAESIHAASVLSFNNAGKLKTAKALSHFLVGGQTVVAGNLVELPEADFKRMETNGQVVEATPEEIAAALAGK